MDKKYLGNSCNKLLGIGIPYLLINLLLFHGYTKNINYTVMLLFPSRMLEYHFSKGFVMLEQNSNKLLRIENETKQRIHDIDMHDSDYIMTCTT